MKGSLRRRVMIWLLVLFGVYVGVCFALAGMYRHPMRSEEFTPPEFGELTIGRTPVWVIGPEKPKASFVMCHGYGGTRFSWVEEAKHLAKRGYRCYLPSMPAHGKSPETEVGFGVTERQVALNVAHEARKAGGPVLGVGVSLGGSAIWLACEKDPHAFDAVCTEGAFGSLSDATDAFLDAALPAGHVVFRPVRWIAEWQSGVKADSIRPIDGAKAFRGKPTLIIHGSEDRLFPLRFGEELAQANGSKMWCVQGGRHAMCYDIVPEEYVDRLDGLAKACLRR